MNPISSTTQVMSVDWRWTRSPCRGLCRWRQHRARWDVRRWRSYQRMMIDRGTQLICSGLEVNYSIIVTHPTSLM